MTTSYPLLVYLKVSMKFAREPETSKANYTRYVTHFKFMYGILDFVCSRFLRRFYDSDFFAVLKIG